MINTLHLKCPINEFIKFLDSNILILSKSNDIKCTEEILNKISCEILDYIYPCDLILELDSSCKYISNEYSPIKNKENVEYAKKRTLLSLNKIKEFINYNKLNILDYKASIDEYNSILILKKIMNNFPLHIKTMYLDQCHGKGNIQNSQLNHIQIGNEYDVQRMLLSLIKPIFPNATTEVLDNLGCTTIRYDIDIDSCDTTIEVKCSRPSMTEKSLNEEMGSDSFHYKRKNIIFFVYDKESIISNIDSYKKAYNKSFDGKFIDIIIIQPIKL